MVRERWQVGRRHDDSVEAVGHPQGEPGLVIGVGLVHGVLNGGHPVGAEEPVVLEQQHVRAHRPHLHQRAERRHQVAALPLHLGLGACAARIAPARRARERWLWWRLGDEGGTVGVELGSVVEDRVGLGRLVVVDHHHVCARVQRVPWVRGQLLKNRVQCAQQVVRVAAASDAHQGEAKPDVRHGCAVAAVAASAATSNGAAAAAAATAAAGGGGAAAAAAAAATTAAHRPAAGSLAMNRMLDGLQHAGIDRVISPLGDQLTEGHRIPLSHQCQCTKCCTVLCTRSAAASSTAAHLSHEEHPGHADTSNAGGSEQRHVPLARRRLRLPRRRRRARGRKPHWAMLPASPSPRTRPTPSCGNIPTRVENLYSKVT